MNRQVISYLPCIHKRKEEIGELFHEHLGTEKGLSDPTLLTRVARKHLRNIFLTRRAALTGVNFAVAETGEYVVCTNEGNADMGAHLSEVQIASMGLEKIIPEKKHLGVFLRLLARSATGQPITIYSSHYKKPRQGQEMHLILVDAGRTRQLGRADFRDSLKCIKCGACMNTCPVYRKSGGLSYHNTISGPIGAILAPNLDMKKHADLPFASTLCGSCSNVCPVKINIHEQLYKWRQVIVKEGYAANTKALSMKAMAWTLSSPNTFTNAGKAGRWFLHNIPFVVNNKFNPWYKQRDMPEGPKESFAEWYVKISKNNIYEYKGKNIASCFKKSTSVNAAAGYKYFKGDHNDAVQKYMNVFKAIGGAALLVDDIAEVKALINKNFDINKRIVTTIAGIE